MTAIKSKAAKMHDALRQLQTENSLDTGVCQAIDQFLENASHGDLTRLHNIVTTYPSRAEALVALSEHEHNWQTDPHSRLIDICAVCGEERA